MPATKAVQEAQTPNGGVSTAEDSQWAVIERWGGDPAMLEKGFLPVPTLFMRYHATMRPRLKPAEAMFVLQLMTFKWDKRAPHPGYKTLAQRMGVSEAYVRKIARALEEKKYLRRRPRVSQTNRFDLRPLFLQLVAHAQAESVSQRKKRPATEEE